MPDLARTLRLTRFNVILLSRNRLAFLYATVLPLMPLLLLFTGDRGSRDLGESTITTLLLIVGLFPVYYNVLSQFVSRRDELVLKRMRTGEARDGELLASIALPGAVSALVVCALAVPIAVALDQRFPAQPLLYALAAVLAVIMFTAFAYWTAAWTRSAEAAQLTSMPIIFLSFLGSIAPQLDGVLHDLVALTPGAALSELVRVGWFAEDGSGLVPLLVMAAWTAVAVALAGRSLRWEPRS